MSENPSQEPAPFENGEVNQKMSGSASSEQKPSENRRSDTWIWGVILIVLGGLFLAQNLLVSFRLVNWWAIFILLPAAGSFVSAWRQYQESGRLNGGARRSLFGGLIFTVVAAIFLLNLDLGKFWPVFVIAAGLAVMTNALLPD